MKTLLFLLIGFFCLTGIHSAFAQGNDHGYSKCPKHKRNEIDASLVPATIITMFTTDHPNAKRVKWYQSVADQNKYIAKYHENGQHSRAVYIYTPPNQCIGVPLNPIPPVVTQTLAAVYPNAIVCCATQNADGSYEVHLTTGDQRNLVVAIDSRGNIVSETQLL